MVNSASLLKRLPGKTGSRVRIPPPPPFFFFVVYCSHMAHVIDLKKDKHEVKKVVEEKMPAVADTVSHDTINQEVTPTLAGVVAQGTYDTVYPHPIFDNQQVMTDGGGRLPFRTLRWIGPLGYRTEGTGIPYFLGLLFVIGGLAIAFFQGDWIAGLLFIGMGAMLFVHSRSPHQHVQIEITPVSVQLGNHKYSHTDILSFWVHYDLSHGIPELSLHLKRWHMPYMKIPLYDQDPSQVRTILLEFVPEVEHDDPAGHRFLKHIGV